MKEIKQFTNHQSIDQVLWDSFVTNPMQSWAWGESRKELGIKLFRFGIYENNILKNVFHITLHGVKNISYQMGYIARSFIPDEYVCTFLKKFAQENKIIFIKFEPDVFRKDLKKEITGLLKKTNQDNFALWTQVLDTTESVENIFKNFSKTVRRDIRFGEKNEINVTISNDINDYAIFEDIYFQTTKRQKFLGHNKHYHKIVFESLRRYNNVYIFIARDKEEKPVAVSEVVSFKDKLYYVYAGSLGKETPVGAMYILIWNIINYGKQKNLISLDFWGSLPPQYDTNHPWAGFTKFKQAFGGEFREYVGSYDLIAFPFLYQLYKVFFLLRNILTKIRKRLS